MIKGFGPVHSKAAFIADFPQGKDFETGYSLTGYSGDLLRNFCKEQKLTLEDFYRTCLIKEKAPDSSLDKDKFESAVGSLKKTYGPLLLEELNEIKPNLLIPLGELSFSYLTNLTNIRKFRGSVLSPIGELSVNQENLKVLPILGPYPYLNQEYRLRAVSRIDFSKIHKYLNNDPIPDNQYNIWVARSSTALRAYLDRAYKECMDREGFLVFDIETYLQIPICISFCFDGFESVCIPILDSTIEVDQRALMVELVDRILRSPVPKVNQNIKYDWKILERWGFRVNNVVGDTMLASSTLYCEFPKNLGFLTSIYTELPYFKDEGKEFDPEKGKRDRYYLYNAKDSLATSQIYTKQKPELIELGTKQVYDNLITILPIYRRMEDRGFRIDDEKRQKLLARYESLFHVQELKCRKLLGWDYFNPLSHKQCHDAIFDELGYKKLRGMKSTKDGKASTDEESLDYLLVHGIAERSPNFGPVILAAILGARKVKKVLEILELPAYPDGRFRCEYNLTGTENARTSAGKTTDQIIVLEGNKVFLVNLGHSLQTIGKHGFTIDGMTYGKDLRSIFVPSRGYVFVECDLNSAEARVDRVLSGNLDMSIFNPPGIHRLTGSWLYNCKPDEIKKNTLVDGVDRYHMSKTVRHAAERNMGPDRLVMMTQRPLKECKDILDKLHSFQPEIKRGFHSGIKNALDAPEHCLIAPNGRRRDFYDRIERETYNEGISFLPQAIVSDQTKFAGIGRTFCDSSIYSWAHLLEEGHDGILAEVVKGRELEFAELYKRNVESEPIDFRKCTLSRDLQLVIPCEVAIGESWFEEDLKEVQLSELAATKN